MHPLIQEIIKLIQRIQDLWNQIVRTINAMLAAVPAALAWVVDRVNALWNEVLAMWDQFWNGIQRLIDAFGDPVAVGRAKDGWLDEVASPAGQIAQTVSPGQLLADDDNWKGQAANKYRTRAAEQAETIAALRDEIATTMTNSLGQLKTAMIVLYGAIIGVFAVLISAIVGAIAAAATVVAIPAAIATIIGAGIVAIAGLVAAFALFSAHVDDQANQMRLALTGVKTTAWPDFVT